MLIILLTISSCLSYTVSAQQIRIREATISDTKAAFKEKILTSRELVQFYLDEITRHNPHLNGVIDVKLDALYDTEKADHEHERNSTAALLALHGIPVLLKGNMGTQGKLNTTAGSYALLGSVVRGDARVVTNLKDAGAIILGKSTISEWGYFRSSTAPNAWSARGGLGRVSISNLISFICSNIINWNNNDTQIFHQFKHFANIYLFSLSRFSYYQILLYVYLLAFSLSLSTSTREFECVFSSKLE